MSPKNTGRNFQRKKETSGITMKLAFVLFLLLIPAAITQFGGENECECKKIRCHMTEISGALDSLCGPIGQPCTPTDCPVEWESVGLVQLGTIDMCSTRIQSFTIPTCVPTTAKEVLVYVYVTKGTSSDMFAQMEIYTASSTRQFVKYLPIKTYNQTAYSTVSENMWFPVTDDGFIHVRLSASLTGNVDGYINIIGYR